MIKNPTRDKIKSQALNELAFARRHKEGKVGNWHLNESMYFGKKEKTVDSRANVDLSRMQEHVHVVLSKIDAPLTFEFMMKKPAQRKRVGRLNALKDYDSDRNEWEIKDIVGKKQAVLYGRAIYAYHASSEDGYTPELENVDVYDFLIDPSAGGIDLEDARYMGRYGVVKDRSELEGNKDYIQEEVKTLLQGKGNAGERTRETVHKDNRTYATRLNSNEKQHDDPDKFKFWEWFTTYGGDRYYLLMTNDGHCIRCEKLTDLFESGLWPFWTYACFPDLTEFWTLGYCDYVREIFMAQAVSINQMLDNAEMINRPTRVVDVTMVDNLAELKYRRGGGFIKAKAGGAKNAIDTLEVPSIDTPIKVFQTLENIQARASGVTAAAAGVEDTDGRATIYEGNAANTADRFGLLNKSYSFGYKRFAKLWEHGVREHLTKEISVDVLGPDGIELVAVGPDNLFKGDEDYAVKVKSSNAELQISEQKKRSVAAYYGSLIGNPAVPNQPKVIEKLGEVAGAEVEDIRQILDTNGYASSDIMSEAERDIEIILDGNMIQPNRKANTAYKQRFVDYIQDHEEDIDFETSQRLVQYIRSLDQVIVSNTRREVRENAKEGLVGQGQSPNQLRAPGPAQPVQDVIQQNT